MIYIFVPKLQTSHISKIPKDHLLDTVSPTIIYSRGALTKTALTCTNIHVPHVIKDTQCLGHVTNTNTIGKQTTIVPNKLADRVDELSKQDRQQT